MAASLTKKFEPLFITGPILDKELRVSSRRRRNYVLRPAYVIVLAFFVVVTWTHVVVLSSNIIYQKAQMAVAGRYIVESILTFQFIAAQIIAIIMLSTAVSDEILHRTLGVLMTTPVSSFQIVTGKLLSKLLQIILLLAISLPLLIIVRFLGGVDISYIISSLCVTLTAVIFAGSLSLFFSIFSRKAYLVIILTILTIGVLFVMLPLWLNSLIFDHRHISEKILYFNSFITHLNPYLFFSASVKLLLDQTTNISSLFLNPGYKLTLKFFLWPVHCAFMLALSSVVIYLSTKYVRRIGLAQISGGFGVNSLVRRSKLAASSKKTNVKKKDTAIRSVKGSPVVWKEMISRFSSREKIFVGTIIAVELIMIVAMYLFPFIAGNVGIEIAYTSYLGIFLGMGLLSVIIFSAACIASEKEAGTWPILLTTTLTDRQILLGKTVGVLRRSIPAWILLIIFLIPFSDTELVFTKGIFRLMTLVLGLSMFLCCSGLYFSLRLRHTNTAIAANFVLAVLLGVIVYILNSFIIEAYHIKPKIDFIYIYVLIFLGLVFAGFVKYQFRRDVF
jgi:ABC-type transport system involved in multi-copper enzyme maturation permease subunit